MLKRSDKTTEEEIPKEIRVYFETLRRIQDETYEKRRLLGQELIRELTQVGVRND